MVLQLKTETQLHAVERCPRQHESLEATRENVKLLKQLVRDLDHLDYLAGNVVKDTVKAIT